MSEIKYIDCLKDNWGEVDCEKRPLSPYDNPTILDEIIFKFKTTKTGDLCANCCEEEDELCDAECVNPYKFDNIKIYFIERNFSNTKAYEDENQNTFYYSDATVVVNIGNEDYPAWLSTDPQNAYIKKNDFDKNGNPLVGCFEYVWNPVGLREGDYFVCWTYTPYAGGASISSHIKFYLNSSSEINTSIPTHRTNPKKYYELLERYTPEMFKEYISEKDQTPNVLDKLNKSIASGFNVLEDLSNQIVDLLDSNAVNEYIIYYLSNTLNLKLKSSDPTLWRRQIKEAVPLYKTKGTLRSLKESLNQAGMNLLRVSNYWQLVSPFYFTESFIYENNSTFVLTNILLEGEIPQVSRFSIDNIESVITPDDYEIIRSDYSTKILVNYPLSKDEIVLIRYCYNKPITERQHQISNYIDDLPLLDNRDQYKNKLIVYPLKNWNVRLIDENDPMINEIISTRHPFQKSIVFGKVRTEFPYSENLYNSEEYNGSLRESLNPCDIDLDFIDKCSNCRSSNFDVDIEIQSLSDDRIQESREVILENTPFHSVLRSINFFGGNYEYVATPIEYCDILLTYKYVENNLSGDTQRWFYRSKIDTDLKNRNELADKAFSFEGNISLYNEKIVLFCANFNFEELNYYRDRYVEILSPSVYSGVYSINNPNKNYVDISVSNYINDSIFSFNVFDDLGSFLADLERNDYIELTEEDSLINFFELSIDSSFKIIINNNEYEIKSILGPNRIILINKNNSITGNMTSSYRIINPEGLDVILKNDTIISTCKILYNNITFVNKPIEFNQDLLKNLDLEVVFQKNIPGGVRTYNCKVIDYNNDGFYIKNYYEENVGGILVKIRYIIRKNESGSLILNGTKAETNINLGQNFINNYDKYSIKIVSENFENNYYFISGIQQQDGKFFLDLYGDYEHFGLYDQKKQCTAQFFNYKEKTVNIEDKNNNLPEAELEFNRSNSSVVQSKISSNSAPDENVYIQDSNDAFKEFSVQKENIFVRIQTIDGEEKEVKL